MFWKMKKKYKVKNTDRRVSGEFKKNPKKDLRPWSKVFFTFALASLIWGANELLNFTQYDYSILNTSGTTSTVVVSDPNAGESTEGTINILSLELEQIENLANTVAGQNAIWPGYKGDKSDHRAVNKHFQEQFAKFINSGVIPNVAEYDGRTVAFAYAVSDTGVIQFVGKIPGGNAPDSAYIMMMDISGKAQVFPAQDESGENIIMLYYIKVRFAVA